MDSDDDADWTSVSCILTKTYLPRIIMNIDISHNECY